MSFHDNARIDSSRVQRRRGGRRGKVVGGSIGGVGLALVLFFASQWLGIDLTPLTGQITGGASQSVTDEQIGFEDCKTGADANKDDECRMAAAANSLDAFWETQLDGYVEPGVVLYRDATQSDCGAASNQVGPFYCPSDESIYIDTEFYDLLRSQFGASGGPLAQMYVLAHEWGHHISHLTGDLSGSSRGAGADSESVRVELQADCYAGAWVAAASTTVDDAGTAFLEPVTAEQMADALDAAAAVGDDHIQQSAGQQVNPEGFTHGTSDQRQRWFTRGHDEGARSCDTFSVAGSEL